jgi:imidazolonepropionase-like amidohydrolase
VIDVLTGERLHHRAVETGADGTVTQVAAAAPAGRPDTEVVDVAGRWLLPGLISCHTHLSASIQRAIRAGVTLVNGTDFPPGDHVDGIPAAVHELLLMAEAGLSPLLSLQSVSVNAAALLGLGDRAGQIAPGYAADFVAVAADPLDELAALRTISLVVQGGRVIREDTDGTRWSRERWRA